MTAPQDTGDLFVRDGQAGLIASRAFIYDLGRAIEDGDGPADIADWIAMRLEGDKNKSGVGSGNDEHDPYCDCECDCCDMGATAPRKFPDPGDPEVARQIRALDRFERQHDLQVTIFKDPEAADQVDPSELAAALNLVRHLREYPVSGFTSNVMDLTKMIEALEQAAPLVSALVAVANNDVDADDLRDRLGPAQA